MSSENDALARLKDLRVGVLAGGISGERDVSLRSGAAVRGALRDEGLDAVLIDVTSPDVVPHVKAAGVGIVFIALHGGPGEDGTVQGELERAGVLYTGSGPDPCAMAMDKIRSKSVFRAHGLSVPDWYEVPQGGINVPAGTGYPCVVKPVSEGSSLGLTVVSQPCRLERALEKARRFQDRVLLEAFIPGREITVGILEERALPVLEIVPAAGIYDHNAKYSSAGTRYIVPAELPSPVARRVQEVALTAHNALGCRHFSRVDLRLAADEGIYVLEVNTVPGLTARSLLPKAALANGLDFRELCVKILCCALESEVHCRISEGCDDEQEKEKG